MVFERMVLADAFDFSFNIVLRSDKNFEWVYLVEDDLVGRGEVPDNLLQNSVFTSCFSLLYHTNMPDRFFRSHQNDG